MDSILTTLETQVKTDFDKNNRILTFEEYIRMATQNPAAQMRSTARYLLDCMDYFGKSENPHGESHFKIFDMEFEDPRHRVIDENEVQNNIYRSLQNFVKEGINNKLILLHGPNGSSKSSIINCLIRGLEKYSETPQGAVYKFNWIFPIDKIVKGGLGLASYSGAKGGVDSYAKLNDDEISCKITCELKDHPVLLIPASSRKQLFKNLPSDYLLKGNLCNKCKQIFESLLASHKGDIKKVLMHVQVERFYMSKRYRQGVVTIEPQMHVDAASRQITMDKNWSALPASLQSISLHELSGDLIDGNRGIIEYADLLKRPVDTFKYLLTTCESGSVNVGSSTATLDTVFIGSTNELQLDAFKEFPDFTSFKARIELIRVPYLLQYSQEQKIYDIHVEKIKATKHVTPHTTFVAALWAVLTRLKKPNAIHYAPTLTNIVGSLSPIEKARLYDHAEVPEQLNAEEKKVLKSSIKKLREEYHAVPYYEGRIGASAREIKNILYEASQNAEFTCLSPISLLYALDEFIKRVSEYEFLKQDIKDGYHDSQEFISTVKKQYIGILDKEVRQAMGLFESKQYEDFLKKYIVHVSHLLKKEKIKNPITGKMESPDTGLIDQFEEIIEVPQGAADKEAFRQNVISSIGAYALDNPNKTVEYGLVFPEFMKKLENHYFEHQKFQMRKISDAIQFLGTEKEDSTSDHHRLATQTIENMINKMGYCTGCASRAILFLVQNKY